MATAFQDVLTKLTAQKEALGGQMKAVECLEATRHALADLGFDAAVSAKEGRLRLEVRLGAVRALPAPVPDPAPTLVEDPAPPPPAPAPSVPLVRDAPLETPQPLHPEPLAAPCFKPGDRAETPPDSELVSGPFSEAEFDQLVDMHLAGKSAGEIAAELGRKPYSIHNKLRIARAEIEQRQRAQVDTEVAAAAPSKPPEPDYVTGPFSAAEKAIVEEMAREGAEASVIATHLGRNKSPVVLQMRRALAQVKPAPSQAPPPSEVPISETHIDKHLDKLGYAGGWTAGRDLQLAEIIARGDGIATAGAVLQVKSDKAKERWFALNTKRGDIDHQARLLRVLRRRAGA